jgi:hypothetical protein
MTKRSPHARDTPAGHFSRGTPLTMSTCSSVTGNTVAFRRPSSMLRRIELLVRFLQDELS